MINGVIFDMDGTLLDTEKYFREAWVTTSLKWGFSDGESFYENVAGRPVSTIKDMFISTYKKSEEEFEAFVTERVDIVNKMLKKCVPVKPYCFELLEYLKQNGIPTALATSTPMSITGNNLESAKIGKYLDAVVTGEMVERGKPFPDIFLAAAERIGVKACECAVVEDSYNGLRGAYAGGMQPIMVIDGQMPNEETHRIALAECEDLRGVLEVIKSIRDK